MANIKVGDKVKSSIIRDCDGTYPVCEVVAISEPGYSGWEGLSPEDDVMVTLRDLLRGDNEVFIDTIF